MLHVYFDSDCNGLFIQTTINPRHPSNLKVDNVLKQFPTISKWSLCIVHPPTQKAFNIPSVKHKKENWNIPRYIHIVDHPNSPNSKTN